MLKIERSIIRVADYSPGKCPVMDAEGDVFDLVTMHTSKILEADHFQYHYLDPDGGRTSAVSFQTVCPDYHILDRLGIVSVPFEAGLRRTGLAVLAWTTAYYDAMRAAHPDGFFNYPQHYLFYTESGTPTDKALRSWGHLDVWPDCKRVASRDSVMGIVERLFDYEINRLLWPCSLSSAEGGTLPDHVKSMLSTRLKAVYLYDSDSPTFEIHGAEPAVRLTREVFEQAGLDASSDSSELSVEAYQQIDVDRFLETFLGSVFDRP